MNHQCEPPLNLCEVFVFVLGRYFEQALPVLLSFMLKQCHKESRMCVWECENMMGRQWELCDDYPSLQAMGWHNNEIGSMKVQSGA